MRLFTFGLIREFNPFIPGDKEYTETQMKATIGPTPQIEWFESKDLDLFANLIGAKWVGEFRGDAKVCPEGTVPERGVVLQLREN